MGADIYDIEKITIFDEHHNKGVLDFYYDVLQYVFVWKGDKEKANEVYNCIREFMEGFELNGVHFQKKCPIAMPRGATAHTLRTLPLAGSKNT